MDQANVFDVGDDTFQTAVLERSMQVPVIVDLWAPWCGPCKTLGPIIEKVVNESNGQIVLAKVNVDENPATSQAFQVQGIPAVYGMKNGQVVDGFVGAQGEDAVREFIGRLLPSPEELEIASLLEAGDEASLRTVLSRVSDHHVAVPALAELLVARGDNDEALQLLARIPETAEARRIAALARTGVAAPVSPLYTGDGVSNDGSDDSGDAAAAAAAVADDFDERLTALLDQVKTDDDARQQYVDLLEVMGPDDPRTADYRKQLSIRLF